MTAFVRRYWMLLASIAVLFAFLGARGLNEPDEGRYAEIGREMAVTGEWLVPHLNGFPHFQKPPILYWATATSLKLLGFNEWGARLPSALAALGNVLLTAWMGRRLFGRTAGQIAGITLLSMFGFFALARLLTPDMLLTFWTTLAIACFVGHVRREDPSALSEGSSGGAFARCWIWGFFVSMGLGFLTKGPMAFIVPISFASAWQLAARRSDFRVRVPWVRGIALALAIGLSWFVALAVSNRELFDYFWEYEFVGRFASGVHGRSRPFWFFGPVLLVALLPWTFLIPGLARRAWCAVRSGRPDSAEWALLTWAILPLAVISASGSKLPTYILPLLPALALGIARWKAREKAIPRWIAWTAGGAAALWVLAAACMPLVNDALRQQATLRSLAHLIDADPLSKGAKVYAVEIRGHGLEFYLGRLVYTTVGQADIVLPVEGEAATRLIEGKRFKARSIEPARGEAPVYAVTRTGKAEKDFLAERWTEMGRAGDFVLLKAVAGASALAPAADAE